MTNDFYFHSFSKDKDIFDSVTKEQEVRGYYKLPFANLEHLDNIEKDYPQKDIVVIGIGGSSLGTYAIYNFLHDTKNYQSDKNLYMLESTDPLSIKAKINKINLKDALFIVISKSGTTVETISIFKYIASLIEITKQNCIVISEDDSTLTKFAQTKQIKQFTIPKDVGGRFSVLSNVGLIPLKLMGIDIELLLKGAREVYESFFEKDEYYQTLMGKARFIAENKDKYNINAIFSYSEMFEGFNKWYIQLWGESLGKINENKMNVGLTPIGLLGPVDQHSFLQLIIEGPRDKTVTFIKIKDFSSKMKVPNISLEYLESLDILNGLDFATLINMQADSTIEAVKNLKDIPVDVIQIESVTEYSIGKLMFYYELLTSLVARFLEIDAYDQPGVELGKIILKDKFKNR